MRNCVSAFCLENWEGEDMRGVAKGGWYKPKGSKVWHYFYYPWGESICGRVEPEVKTSRALEPDTGQGPEDCKYCRAILDTEMEWKINYREDGRIEWLCTHDVGHDNHVHGCDGCCRRDDFPGRRRRK